METKSNSPTVKNQFAALFLGGLLPVIAFTVAEEYYGPVAGVIAGMVFGVGEIIFEWIRYKKVSSITWIGNALILVLGGISIFSAEGIWFKLQPALFEGFFAIFLWGSLFFKKNFLVMAAEKQGQKVPEVLIKKMDGLCFRMGVFFAIHTFLAVWAALYWTTTQWALLKGVGLFGSFLLYLVIELFFIRYQMKKSSHS